jgi:hypothetical protein
VVEAVVSSDDPISGAGAVASAEDIAELDAELDASQLNSKNTRKGGAA